MNHKYDLVVIGGGTSGVVSALGAAKLGNKVLIVEKQSSLTGSQGNALVNPFMPSYYNSSFFGDMILEEYKKFENNDEMILFEKAFAFNTENYKYIVEQVLRKNGVEIFYDTTLIGANVIDGSIKTITCNFLNRNIEISAKYFIDASSNAVLANFCNLVCSSGDESGKNQAVSLRFEIAGIKMKNLRSFLKEMNYTFCSLEKDYLEFVHVPNNQLCGGLLTIFANAISSGELLVEDIRYIQGFTSPNQEGVLNFNGPQIPNEYDIKYPKEYSDAIIRGREMQQRLVVFLKNNIPGFEEAYISKCANMLGIRESFEIIGDYILTEDDYINRRKFDDAIAKGDWYIDIHTDDLEVESSDFKAKFEDGEYYEIPFRSIMNSNVKNLLFVGRHISATFKMQSSIRIQHTCYQMASNASFIVDYANKNNISFDLIKIKNVKKMYKEFND